jgi:hypothetical protein
VEPRREQRPAPGLGALGVGLHEVDHRGQEEEAEAEPSGELEAHARDACGAAEQSQRGPFGRARLQHAPEQPPEKQRDSALHDREQHRVVVGVRVARRRDVPTEVDLVRQATADEFGRKRE